MRGAFKVAIGLFIFSTGCVAEDVYKSQSVNAEQTGSWSYISASVFTGNVRYEIDSSGNYFGSDYTISGTDKAKGFIASLGTVDSAGIGLEGYFKFEDNDGWDNSIAAFGGSLRKSFGESAQGRPFLKLGLELGATELEDDPNIITTEDSIAYYGILFGAGYEKRINGDFEVFGGVDIGQRWWQDIELTDFFGNRQTIENSGRPILFNAGLRFKL